jgi:tetratricopeptide (TPR) repeat protein
MTRQRLLITGLLLVLFAAVVVTAAESNSVDVSSKGKQTGTPAAIENSQEKCKSSSGNKNEDYVVENQVLKYAVKSYEESIATLRWAIGGIITLIGILAAAVGYVVVKHSREYKDAVSEAKKASEDASRCAEKAQEKLDSIDEMVERKLKEIEDKGKAQIEALIKEADKRRQEAQEEAERQRKIIELWNEGLRAIKNEDYESAASGFQQIVENFKLEDAGAYNIWGAALLELAKRKEGDVAERLFAEAISKFEKAVVIKVDYHESYNNWGNALLELARRKEGYLAERLLAEAIAKCKKAVMIRPDFPQAYYGWGTALTNLARCKEGDEAELLFAEAIGKYEKAVAITPDDHEVYHNWGAALADLVKRKEGDDAERLFAEAITKFEKVISIKPDFPMSYSGWGAVLLYLAVRKKGNERKALLEKAKEKCLKAESIKRGTGAYNLACANCLLGDEGECRRWLKVGEEEKTLQTREYAMTDEDLESVRNKDWFKAIRWKGE